MNSTFGSEIKRTFPAFLPVLVFVLFLVKTSNAQINTWQKQSDVGADFPDGPPFNGPNDFCCYYGIGFFRFVFEHKVIFGVTVDRKRVQVYEYDKKKDKWTRKSDMPVEDLDRGFHFTLKGKGYVGGGWLGGRLTRDFWEYDPLSDSWRQVEKVPEEFSEPVAFSVEQKGYVIQYSSRSIYEFDPDLNKWQKKRDFPGTIRDGDASSFVIGNAAYFGLGFAYDRYPNVKYLRDFWRYQPGIDSWTRIADFPDTAIIVENVGYSYRSFGYIGFGRYQDNLRKDRYTRVWQYDPNRNLWSLSDIGFVDM